MRFLFKYPTRSRPDWFKKTLREYYQRLSGEHEYYFLIAMDTDDFSMQRSRFISMRAWLDMQKDLAYYYLSHKNKIDACNSGIEHLLWQWDVVILISDDMVPTVDGFDDIIATDMATHFPDFSGCLHYWDHYRPKEDPVVTWTVAGRGFYDRYGCLYHPDYKSVWCDNELTDVAESWGKLVHCDAEIVKHYWMKHGTDASYQKGNDDFAADKETYERRKEEGFPSVQSK